MDLSTVQITASQVLVMFLLMAVGFVAIKIKLLSPETCGQVNKLLLNVVSPAILLRSFNRAFSANLLVQLGYCTLLFALGLGIAVACAYIFVRGRDEKSRTERYSICFPNCGFMGIPLIQAVLGDEAVIFASCGVAMFQLGCWTYGRATLAGGLGSPREAIRKIFLNPGVLGVAAGVLLFVSPWTLGGPVEATVGFIADLNTPLAMMIVGTFVARVNIKEALRGISVWRASLFRLLIIPALCLPLYMLIPAPYEPAIAAFIMTCCPVGAMASMLPNMLGMREGEKHGSAFVSVSTLLSALTIPAMMFIYQLI